jgi:hypothetical protein
MNTGMQDAFNLAWKLALVFHGTCHDDPVLASYSQERSSVGDQVLKAAGMFTSVAIMQGAWKQAIRNHVASLVLGFKPFRNMAVKTLEELSIGYPDSPLNARVEHHGPYPAPGDRAPVREDEPPVGGGTRPRFALFGDPHDRFSQLAVQYPALLEPAIRKPFRNGGLWLVRPDGYVALSSASDAWGDVDAYLARIAVA